MSSTIQPLAGRPRRYRWNGADFDRASESGVFDHQRVELIDGEILEMPAMNDPHAQAIQLANYALLPVFPPSTTTIRIQCPMRLGEARPLPDLAVVAGTPRQIVQHPVTALLVIEVSDTTLEFDRTDKAELYAAHGIADYWIINLKGKCVEVRRKPLGIELGDPQYGELQVSSSTETVSPLAAPNALIRVSDLLP